MGKQKSSDPTLSLYLVEKPITCYEEALESIESFLPTKYATCSKHETTVLPIEAPVEFSLHSCGTSSLASNKPSQAILKRKLGSKPYLRVVNHNVYSTVCLGNSHSVSIVGLLRVQKKLFLCFLSDFSIIAVNTDITQDILDPQEVILIQSKHTFPWMDIEAILKSR